MHIKYLSKLNLLSSVWPGQDSFSPEAGRGHSWASWPKLAKQTGYSIPCAIIRSSEWGSWPGAS